MENIKVLRREELETREVMVGDQILVSLAEIGNFTATAHKITDKGVLFIFDEYVTSRPMNNQSRIDDLSIPTVGELFGHDDEWDNEHFEPDEDEQLPLMKERRNRVAYLNNEWEWGWLRNAVKQRFSSAHFAGVGGNGTAGYAFASSSGGVRPEFWLVR